MRKEEPREKNSHLRGKIIIASKRNSFSVLTAGEKNLNIKER